MSLPDPSTHKHIGRGVRNFESAVWDRDKQNAVLSGNYAKFLQNPAIKHHLLSTGNKRFAEASPLDPVWCIELRVDDRQANDARQWRGKNCSRRRFLPSAKQFAKVRPGWPTRPSLAGSALLPGMLELKNFVIAAVVLVDHGQHLPRSSLGVFDLFLGCTGRPKPGRFGDSFWRRPRKIWR